MVSLSVPAVSVVGLVPKRPAAVDGVAAEVVAGAALVVAGCVVLVTVGAPNSAPAGFGVEEAGAAPPKGLGAAAVVAAGAAEVVDGLFPNRPPAGAAVVVEPDEVAAALDVVGVAGLLPNREPAVVEPPAAGACEAGVD